MKDIYLFTPQENKRKEEVVNRLEKLLNASGCSMKDKENLPATDEAMYSFFWDITIDEETGKQLAEDYSFISEKMKRKFFYLTYHLEIRPTEQDGNIFGYIPGENEKPLERFMSWGYFTSESVRINGIRIETPIEEGTLTYNLLDWQEIKNNTVSEETLSEIRKGLNLTDHFYVTAEDYFSVSLCSYFLEILREQGKLAGKITLERSNHLDYPLDKWNSVFWGTKAENYGQTIGIDFTSGEDKKAKRGPVYGSYSIAIDDIDEEDLEKEGITLSRKLTSFDKRVYCAIGSSEGGYTSIRNIYYNMGNTSRPNDKQIERIKKSVDKMRKTDITFENEEEAKKYNYDLFKYKGYLLPVDYIEASINGKVDQVAIRILREPPLFAFARGRGQITSVPVELLQSPINKTDKNLAIEHYLIDRITRQNAVQRILFSTIYKKAEIPDTDKTGKARARKTVEVLFDFYVKKGIISSYSKDRAGISFCK